jgi:hypothetical protein
VCTYTLQSEFSFIFMYRPFSYLIATTNLNLRKRLVCVCKQPKFSPEFEWEGSRAEVQKWK